MTSKGCHSEGVRWWLFLWTPAPLLSPTMRAFEVSSPMRTLLRCGHLKRSTAFGFACNCCDFFICYQFLRAPLDCYHMLSAWPFPLPNYPALTSNVLSGQSAELLIGFAQWCRSRWSRLSVLQTKDYTNKSLDTDYSALHFTSPSPILLSEELFGLSSILAGEYKNIRARFIVVSLHFLF